MKNRFSEEKFVPNRVAPSMNVVKTIKRVMSAELGDWLIASEPGRVEGWRGAP